MLDTFALFEAHRAPAFIEYHFGTDTKNPLDFGTDPLLKEFLYERHRPNNVKLLNRLLRENLNKTMVLYHATSAKHNILEEGLRRTTGKTKRSMQSQPGFVYLSIYENHAMQFGKMGYAGQPEGVNVYRVLVPVQHIKPDLDQLYNVRLWSDGDTEREQVGTSLAESIIYGSGIRVKGDIPPYMIKLVGSNENPSYPTD